jgi:hypothetical protein
MKPPEKPNFADAAIAADSGTEALGAYRNENRMTSDPKTPTVAGYAAVFNGAGDR